MKDEEIFHCKMITVNNLLVKFDELQKWYFTTASDILKTPDGSRKEDEVIVIIFVLICMFCGI